MIVKTNQNKQKMNFQKLLAKYNYLKAWELLSDYIISQKALRVLLLKLGEKFGLEGTFKVHLLQLPWNVCFMLSIYLLKCIERN